MNNPITKAAHAAWAELTTDEAKAYYASRALEDIDRILTVATAIYSICHFVYSLGALAGEAHYSAVTHTFEAPKAPALPAAPVRAALPAVSSAPIRRRRNRVAPVTRNAPIPAMPVRDYSPPRFYVEVAPIPVARCQGCGHKPRGFAVASGIMGAPMPQKIFSKVLDTIVLSDIY